MAYRGGDAGRWAARARARLVVRLGLDRFRRCLPTPKKTGEVLLPDGIVREEWKIRTERDVWMPFTLLVPRGTRRRLPAVICPHGHSSAGKWSPAGRTDVPAMRPIIRHYNYAYGLELAQRGCVVACPDARGFGERR